MRTHTAFLIDLLRDREVKQVVEIGVFKGDNAFDLLSRLDIELYLGVDPYLRYPEFDDNLSNKAGLMATLDLEVVKKEMLRRMKPFGKRFEHVDDFSTSVASHCDDEALDFVFIDGNHYYDYVVNDINAWLPKVKDGGILAGHDYMEKPNCGVIQATTELLPDMSANLKAKVWWFEKPMLPVVEPVTMASDQEED